MESKWETGLTGETGLGGATGETGRQGETGRAPVGDAPNPEALLYKAVHTYEKIKLALLILVSAGTLALGLLLLAGQQNQSRSTENSRQSLAVLRCSSGITVLIPASDSAWRLRAYKRCLVLSHINPNDPLSTEAVSDTRAVPKV